MQPNRNYGGDSVMDVRALGNNRALVRFSQSDLQSIVGNKPILSAKLRLTIAGNAGGWGNDGRTVDARRLLQDWTEGNGTENNRGTGQGMTWNCAKDSNIANLVKNCNGGSEWEMGQPISGAHPWVQNTSATQTISNGQTGVVEYDVMNDLAGFLNGQSDNYGWILKKTNENQSGAVSFSTREGVSAPQLVVTYQP